MAVVVVDEGEVGVGVFAAPLEALGDTAARCYLSIGGVGVGGFDGAGGAVDFGDVFGEVEAVSVPRAVFLDGQRAGGDGFGRVPGDGAKGR